jgi:hypothetical protein
MVAVMDSATGRWALDAARMCGAPRHVSSALRSFLARRERRRRRLLATLEGIPRISAGTFAVVPVTSGAAAAAVAAAAAAAAAADNPGEEPRKIARARAKLRYTARTCRELLIFLKHQIESLAPTEPAERRASLRRRYIQLRDELVAANSAIAKHDAAQV